MTVMESVREWLGDCDVLEGRLDVDFLDEEADSYSVDTVPCAETLKKYRDGGSRKQFLFAVSSRRFYDQNVMQNLGNLEFFEKLTAWIERQAQRKNFPQMDGGRRALAVAVTSNAYPFVVSEDGKARYQIQARLEYYQKGVDKK